MINLNPKEDKFYKMFILAAKNVNEAANILRQTMDNLQQKETNACEVERLEHKGDKMVHSIIQELNKSFITPIDREDIYAIAKEMDDILDSIDSTIHRFIMFNIDEITEEAKMLSNFIVDSTNEIIGIMSELKNMKKSNDIMEKIIYVNKIENDGDTYFRQAIKDLFDNHTDVLKIIKWREIYQFLEDTIDSCEKVANIIEGVVMKNV